MPSLLICEPIYDHYDLIIPSTSRCSIVEKNHKKDMNNDGNDLFRNMYVYFMYIHTNNLPAVAVYIEWRCVVLGRAELLSAWDPSYKVPCANTGPLEHVVAEVPSSGVWKARVIWVGIGAQHPDDHVTSYVQGLCRVGPHALPDPQEVWRVGHQLL